MSFVSDKQLRNYISIFPQIEVILNETSLMYSKGASASEGFEQKVKVSPKRITDEDFRFGSTLLTAQGTGLNRHTSIAGTRAYEYVYFMNANNEPLRCSAWPNKTESQSLGDLLLQRPEYVNEINHIIFIRVCSLFSIFDAFKGAEAIQQELTFQEVYITVYLPPQNQNGFGTALEQFVENNRKSGKLLHLN